MALSEQSFDDDFASQWLADARFVRQYYQRRLHREGNVTPRSLDWRTTEEHLRFVQTALAHVNWTSVKSVFDVGCGDARCAALLTDLKGGPIDYGGVDLVPEFIQYCWQAHPEADVHIGNFIDPAYLPPDRYDLVMNLGGLNSRVSEPIKHLEACVRKMIGISKKYAVFNLIVDPEPGYFPNQNQHTVGHIGCYESLVVLDVLEEISQRTGWAHHIDRESIFRGCDDMFVTFYDDIA